MHFTQLLELSSLYNVFTLQGAGGGGGERLVCVNRILKPLEVVSFAIWDRVGEMPVCN